MATNNRPAPTLDEIHSYQDFGVRDPEQWKKREKEVDALGEALKDLFPPGQPRMAGDVEGHEFHGNQWTNIAGGAKAPLDTDGFKAHFEARGYKTMTVDELPKELKRQLPVRIPDQPMPVAVADGVAQGLRDIEEKLPAAVAEQLKKTPLVYASYSPAAGATAVNGPPGSFILVNGADDAMGELMRKPASPETAHWTVAQTRAHEMTGDERIREIYRGMIVHEVGHVLDFKSDGALSGDVVSTLLGRFPQSGIAEFLSKNVSGYAARGGPKEATAENFAAAVLEAPLPKELQGAGKRMLQHVGGAQ